MANTLTGVRTREVSDIPQPQTPEATCSIRLSERDAAEVMAAAENPPTPNEAAVQAAGASSSAMDETRIESLTATHETASFDCGKPPLNSFIRQHATFNNERGVSRVNVAVQGVDQRVLAYYASSAGAFLRDHLPPDDQAGLPGYPLPTAHLGRLAVDLSCRGPRLGELLLFHFLKAACDVAERNGVFAVDLFAKDDDPKSFYLKYGFIPLRDDAFHLYLPMATVRAMFLPVTSSPKAHK